MARLEGDEFALAIAGLSAHEVDLILFGVVDRLATTEIDGGTVVLGASVGVTYCDGMARTPDIEADTAADTIRLNGLLEECGLALRQAKRSGRGRVVHVDSATRAALERWRDGTIGEVVEVGVRLQRDLNDRSIAGASVVAQVIVDGTEPLEGQALQVVASALARRFAVLDATLEGIASSGRPIPPAGIRMWFSVPASDVALPGGAEALWARLASVGLTGTPLGVELLAPSLEDPEAVAAAIELLHRHRVEVAVEATGPVAPGVGELARMGVDRFLIDAATVDAVHHNDPTMTAAVRATVELGASCGVEVVALGVGSLDAGRRLEELGVAGAQVVVTEPWAARRAPAELDS